MAAADEASSEEEPVMVNTSGDRFTICWDPLDGSSIVDNNWAVGTIVGIWDKTTGMLGATGRDQVHTPFSHTCICPMV